MVKMTGVLPSPDDLETRFREHFNRVGIRQTRLMSRAVALCISFSGKTAAQVAEEMSDLLDREIRTSQIHKWSSEEDHSNIPRADYLAALCQVTGQYFPVQLLCAPLTEIKVCKRDENLVRKNLEEAKRMRKELDDFIAEQKKFLKVAE